MIQAVAHASKDVKYFRVRTKGKVHIHLFSESQRYLIVLQEREKVFDFITAHPISVRQLDKKKKMYEKSLMTEGGLL